MFSYCSNSPLMYTDALGYWAQNYSGFKWIKNKGFSLNVQLVFLSRAFCLAYAYDIIRLEGRWFWYGARYANMSAIRIAQELWFHAIAYYIGAPIQLALSWFGIKWGWLDAKVTSARYMEINNDDPRAWVFATVWWAATAFKMYIRRAYGTKPPYSYIRI